jgi:hypothetical protein
MTILNWLITSSADPKKTSLAVKGTVLLIGSQLVRLLDMACSFGFACLGVDAMIINQAAEGIETVVYGILILWGGVWFLWGLGRKIYLARWSAAK